jgi:hypothetical protein
VIKNIEKKLSAESKEIAFVSALSPSRFWSSKILSTASRRSRDISTSLLAAVFFKVQPPTSELHIDFTRSVVLSKSMKQNFTFFEKARSVQWLELGLTTELPK